MPQHEFVMAVVVEKGEDIFHRVLLLLRFQGGTTTLPFAPRSRAAMLAQSDRYIERNRLVPLIEHQRFHKYSFRGKIDVAA
jgi:hypothetical protein